MGHTPPLIPLLKELIRPTPIIPFNEMAPSRLLRRKIIIPIAKTINPTLFYIFVPSEVQTYVSQPGTGVTTNYTTEKLT